MGAVDPAGGPVGKQVRKAEETDVEAISKALGAAFADDPVMSWLVRDPGRRPDVLAGNFRMLLEEVWLEHEATYTTATTSGAAIWDPPGKWSVSIPTQVGLLPRAFRVWGRNLPRALLTLAKIERGHPTRSHYYLAVLGVEPESQGRGLGSALMFPILSRCDADGVPAYLEASSPRNRALYERHGFEVTQEFRVGAGAPPIWGMWRDPK
ncbi:MAG TPA: GNAT family N-acetyltransferase [Solirubrobacterales bacterium]|jgi:GNAT superfamily N-acetyltransferase|nr:GNAT family N-acetyltransferase [Solirubrobacterales bacterium]